MEVKNIDGFYWAILEPEEATEAFENGETVAIIDEEGAVYTTIDELKEIEAVEEELMLAVELGREDGLKSDWLEATERNNEKRSFNAWLENLIS